MRCRLPYTENQLGRKLNEIYAVYKCICKERR